MHRKMILILLWVLLGGAEIRAQTGGRTLYTGVINLAADGARFPLIGFVNIGKGEFRSAQVGFANWNQGALKGAQIGFANIAREEAKGMQLGFLNGARSLNGLQLGFLNLVDTVTSGVPIGLLSIVRRGGYQAVEVSLNESYPLNFSFKSGLRKLYSNLYLGLNPFAETGFAYGGGLGSLLPLGNRWWLNPEAVYQNSSKSSNFLVTCSAGVGYALGGNFHLVAGPFASWQHLNQVGAETRPVLYLARVELDARNVLQVGMKIGLRYEFGGKL